MRQKHHTQDGAKPLYIGTQTAADLLGICGRTLHTYLKQGLIPHYRMGRVIRFKTDELIQFIEQDCRVATRDEVLR
jgi:excisionase family DNA binding protein